MCLTNYEHVSLDRPTEAHLFLDAPERPIPNPTTVHEQIRITLARLGRKHPDLDFLSLVALVGRRDGMADDAFLDAAVSLLRAG